VRRAKSFDLLIFIMRLQLESGLPVNTAYPNGDPFLNHQDSLMLLLDFMLSSSLNKGKQLRLSAEHLF
jgi:hypothetical protein